jgi:hypothetical protein
VKASYCRRRGLPGVPPHKAFESFNDFFLFPLSLVVQFIPRKIIKNKLYAQLVKFDAISHHFLPGKTVLMHEECLRKA